MEKSLLTFLVCPQCGKSLKLSDDKQLLLCRVCALAYPIEEGVPVMLVDKARSIEEGESDGKHF